MSGVHIQKKERRASRERIQEDAGRSGAHPGLRGGGRCHFDDAQKKQTSIGRRQTTNNIPPKR
eukprot:8148731-Alexandrium_andersonii.AAC.1